MDNKKEVSRLQKKVSKWLKEWVANSYQKESLEESVGDLALYAQGSKPRMSRVDIMTVHFWHLVHFQHELLNQGASGLEDLALAARHAEAYIHFETAFAEAGKGGAVLLTEASLYLTLAILTGWQDATDRIGKALIRGLDTSLLDLRHTDRHSKGILFRHFWFVLHLFAQARGHTFNTSLYSYPPDMSPYDEVLADWRTTDLTKVHDWVGAMADFHVQETRNRAHDEIDEFDSEDVMLFPYEILCWLRLREWLGLVNPESFSHPLMQQPLARLPAPVPLAVPATPLLDQVIARFRQEYPNSFAGWELRQ